MYIFGCQYKVVVWVAVRGGMIEYGQAHQIKDNMAFVIIIKKHCMCTYIFNHVEATYLLSDVIVLHVCTNFGE